MGEPILVVPYDPAWPRRFAELAARLRQALGPLAVRIDHIGSTSVPGLAAKPVLDVQVSVARFEPLEALKLPLESLGFVHRAQNPDLTKRYFRETPGRSRTHLHVRLAGSWPEQFALLFRDYMRAHDDDCRWYENVKQQLAKQYGEDRQGYTEAKGPHLWEIMKKADRWSQATGWRPRPSDA